MQLRNLEEGNPIELLEAIHYKPRLSYSDLCEEKLIKMGIITDGVLYKTEEEKGFSPESYQFSDTQKIEKKLFSRDIKMHFIDAINSKKVYLKDYSYILVTISRKEWNGPSISYAYKDAYVYFKDINDKTALKEAEKHIIALDNIRENQNVSNDKKVENADITDESSLIYKLIKK